MIAKKGVDCFENVLFASRKSVLSLMPHTLTGGDLNFSSVYICRPSIFFKSPLKLLNSGLPPRKYNLLYSSKSLIIVRCCKACGFRVENFESCTSGIPVSVANKPLAVEKWGVKQ